jgi:hypothetical protein
VSAIPPLRHAELVSASIAPFKPSARDEKWTLKQVQGDELDRYRETARVNHHPIEIIGEAMHGALR